MKFRTDFVTSSSSTNYTTVTIDFVNGKSAKIKLDNNELDSEELFLAAPFLKEIETINKLAAYLVKAFDYYVEGTYYEEKPGFTKDYHTLPIMTHARPNPNKESFFEGGDKYFVPYSQEPDNIVNFIRNLQICTKDEKKEQFISVCTDNVKLCCRRGVLRR